MDPIKNSSRNLIINTGDISDADGFFALAKYATSGADVIFIMNYPAFLDVSEPPHADSNADGLNNFGLGYTYNEREYYEASDALVRVLNENDYTLYKMIKNGYTGRMKPTKQNLTDLGFKMAMEVWDSIQNQDKGTLYFCVGGVNDINPFHKNALKNEIYVYREMGREMIRLTSCSSMDMFNSDGKTVSLNNILKEYKSIYIDFNGSMAFFETAWRGLLRDVKDKIKGLFVMGGVFTDAIPTTLSALKGVLNRMSCSTMNQFYAPGKSHTCFQLMDLWGVPIFMIANNVVTQLRDNVELETFLRMNSVFSGSLFSIAVAFYDSHYKPARKPFDFYVALALVDFMNGGGVPFGSVCNLVINPEYGVTLITNQTSSKDAVKEYTGKWDNDIIVGDNPFTANKKKNFACEQAVLSIVKCTFISNVYKVEFSLNESKLLSIE